MMKSTSIKTGRRKNGWLLAIFPLLTMGLIAYIVYEKFPVISETLFGSPTVSTSTDDEYSLAIDEELTLTGLITSELDTRVYTHTIQTEEYGLIGIKSTMLNLTPYVGWSTIRGTVVDFTQDMFILDVTSAIDDPTSSEEYVDDTILEDVTEGLGQTSLFLNDMHLLVDTSQDLGVSARDSRVSLTPSDGSGDLYEITSFACSETSSASNCSYLEEQFKPIFTSAEGIAFYQLPETTSWLFFNDNLYGYRVQDLTQDQAISLSGLLTIIDEDYIAQKLLPEVISLCSSIDHTLVRVETYDTEFLIGENLAITIDGLDGKNVPVACVIELDVDDASSARLVSIESTGDAVSVVDVIDEKKQAEDEQSEKEYSVDLEDNVAVVPTDVEQFPLKLDKPFIFSSSRGYEITFPSSNIAFEGTNDGIDAVDLDGVDCYALIDVIKYTDEALVHTNPALQLFECAIDDDVTSYGEYLHRSSEDGKEFLIKIVDPSWTEFANYVKIQ